jgi:hypothetical protein
MFDDLRNEGDASPFFQGNEVDPLLDAPKKKSRGAKKKSGKFLGMTAFQRFIISALLMFMTIILGLAFLLVSGAIYLPL